VETAVVAGWVKAFSHRGEPPALYYWRSRDGLEVDLLIDRNGKLHPVEIKATSTVTATHAAGLVRWRQIAGREEAPAVLFADVDRAMTVARSIHAVPWWSV
jgi:predicted AAA+ superfamily ATPase